MYDDPTKGNAMEHDTPSSGKRTDVGYKRPPREHQFKKGHKPKPRKTKPRETELGIGDLLWKVLQEERRAITGNKITWMSAAEALIRKAYELADKGNPTMRRRISELLMRLEKPGGDSQEPRVKGFILNGVEHPFKNGELG